MRVDKMSISFEIELGDNVRHAAEKAGKPLSTWLAEAAATKLRAEALAEFLDDWEAENGAFTEEELEQARRSLRLPSRRLPQEATQRDAQ
jgi:hypothetical protein